MKKEIATLLCMFFYFLASSQTAHMINVKGDLFYDMEQYREASSQYNQSLNKSKAFIPAFNLALCQAKLEKEQEADEAFDVALGESKDSQNKSRVHYNKATLALQSDSMTMEKLELSIDELKSSLRLNPSNTDAQWNLFLAQKMKDQAEQQQQEQQQQQDQQNQEQNQEQQEQSQEQQEQNQEQQQQEQQQNDQEEQQQQQNSEAPEQSKGEIDKKEIANILKMVEEQDKDVQMKLKKNNGSRSESSDKTKKW